MLGTVAVTPPVNATESPALFPNDTVPVLSSVTALVTCVACAPPAELNARLNPLLTPTVNDVAVNPAVRKSVPPVLLALTVASVAFARLTVWTAPPFSVTVPLLVSVPAV